MIARAGAVSLVACADRPSLPIVVGRKSGAYIVIMTTLLDSFAALPNPELIAEVKRLTECERQATAALVASLAEFDARRLYLDEGCSSLFGYCTEVLHLSEHAAYRRIEAARIARRFPLVLERLAAGDITLTAIGMLGAHLTPENVHAALDAARHRSKREVERLVAQLHPQPDVPTAIRKLPSPRGASTDETIRGLDAGASMPGGAPGPLEVPTPPQPSAAFCMEPAQGSSAATAADCSLFRPTPASSRGRAAVVAPLTPERFKLQVTIGAETHARLRRAQDLLRHAVPDGDVAEVLDRALALLVKELERAKFAATDCARKAEASRADSATTPRTVGQAEASRAGSATTPRTARQNGTTARSSRYIPAAVRRAVWARDEGRCAFVGAEGRRCTERGQLEFHHTTPYAAGGEATVEGLSLRCRRHNVWEAERFFGGAHVQAARLAASATAPQ